MIDFNPNNHRYESPEKSMAGCLSYIIGAVLGLIICAMVGSCKTPCGITEMDSIHDTCFITKYNHDSIYQHDSIVIREYLENDTFHVERYKWMVSYRDRISHDTVYISKINTITKKVMIKEEKTLWQKTKDAVRDFFEIAALFLIAGIVVLIVLWGKGK